MIHGSPSASVGAGAAPAATAVFCTKPRAICQASPVSCADDRGPCPSGLPGGRIGVSSARSWPCGSSAATARLLASPPARAAVPGSAAEPAGARAARPADPSPGVGLGRHRVRAAAGDRRLTAARAARPGGHRPAPPRPADRRRRRAADAATTGALRRPAPRRDRGPASGYTSPAAAHAKHHLGQGIARRHWPAAIAGQGRGAKLFDDDLVDAHRTHLGGGGLVDAVGRRVWSVGADSVGAGSVGLDRALRALSYRRWPSIFSAESAAGAAAPSRPCRRAPAAPASRRSRRADRRPLPRVRRPADRRHRYP